MSEMTSRERITAAIALQPVDRVPVIPMLDLFAARNQQVSLAETIRNPDLMREVKMRAFDDLGGWDAMSTPGQLVGELGYTFLGVRAKLPGYELGDYDVWQMDEQEIMTLDDYDFIIENGWNSYLTAVYPRLGYSVHPGEVVAYVERSGAQVLKDLRAWSNKKVPVYLGTGPMPAFELVSFGRSLRSAITDLYRRPDTVLRAIEVIEAEQVPHAVVLAQMTKQMLGEAAPIAAFVPFARASLIAPRLFDKFVWPFLKRLVEQMVEGGIVPNLHCDSDWTPFLEHFLELPAGKVVLQLDGTTDIFKAKEILKGHMCILGDVPAAVLTLGDPREVTHYCTRLIDEVGEGGGFILSGGCDVPVDAKSENVRAMIETAKTYYPHRFL